MKKQIYLHLVLPFLFALFTTGLLGQNYLNKSASIDDRINDLLPRLTLEEKISMLSGDSTGFNSHGVPRVHIPEIRMSDGPVGVRDGLSTAYPVSVNMAASWDTALIYRYGVALGEETRAKGKTCILGPCVGIHRFPLNGRNFESFGEDPFLSSRMAVNYVKGVQSQQVIATVKHFAANDQEWERNNYSSNVDERTLREIHLAPFEAAVKEGHARAIMSAYNKVNGVHCSENRQLLTDILKNDWGFTGVVMSDWVSVYSAVDAANNGLDIEMPEAVWMGDSLLAAVKAGKVSEAIINEKIRRHLRVRFEMGQFDAPLPVANQSAVETPAHRQLAREIAEKSIVLLKNDGVLPLSINQLKTVAVIGPSAKVMRSGGGGSSKVDPWVTVSPLEGIQAVAGKQVKVMYAEGVSIDPEKAVQLPGKYLRAPDGKSQGLLGEYFPNKNWQGKPVLSKIDTAVFFNYGLGSPAPEMPKDNFSIRWTGTLIGPVTGKVRLTLSSDDGSYLYLDDKLLIDNGGDHAEQLLSREVELVQGREYKIRIDFYESGQDASIKLGWTDPAEKMNHEDFAEAIAVAKAADAAVVCVGNTADLEHEGGDVADFTMQFRQDDLVKAIVKANPRTVVVLFGGTPIHMENWVHDAKAVLMAGYPGQEGGSALANILTGKVNPSGKLPFSYIQNRETSRAFDGYRDPSLQVAYSEGVFVGYRYYEMQNIAPLFPFGFGLSYTTFSLSNIHAGKPVNGNVEVTVDVKNTGTVEGSEVVQLYVHPPKAAVSRPVQELKAFAKVALAPGETKTVTLRLNPRSFSYWDTQAKQWRLEAGMYELNAATSSRDLKAKTVVTLP